MVILPFEAMKGNTEIVKKFNAYLIYLESKLYDAHYTLLREDEVITVEALRNKYTIQQENKSRYATSLFKI